MTPDWTTAVGTVLLAFATFILAVVALFQDQLREFLRSPRLDATIEMTPPDCLWIPMARLALIGNQSVSSSAGCYYYRIRVWNRSPDTSARQVEVMGIELRRKTASGAWQIVPEFLPMNFVWSNTMPNPLIVYPQIMSESFKHCDICHIIDPAQRAPFGEDNPSLALSSAQVSVALDQVVKPNNFAHILGPDVYELDLAIAADNARTVRRTLTMNITGSWSNDERAMFSTYTGMTIR